MLLFTKKVDRLEKPVSLSARSQQQNCPFYTQKIDGPRLVIRNKHLEAPQGLSHLPPLGKLVLDIPSGESALATDCRPARFEGFGQTFTGKKAEKREDYRAHSYE